MAALCSVMQTLVHSAVNQMLSPHSLLVRIDNLISFDNCIANPNYVIGAERGPGVGETRPPSFHGGQTAAPGEVGVGGSLVQEGSDGFDPGFDDTESGITSVSQIGRRRPGGQGGRMPLQGNR